MPDLTSDLAKNKPAIESIQQVGYLRGPVP